MREALHHPRRWIVTSTHEFPPRMVSDLYGCAVLKSRLPTPLRAASDPRGAQPPCRSWASESDARSSLRFGRCDRSSDESVEYEWSVAVGGSDASR